MDSNIIRYKTSVLNDTDSKSKSSKGPRFNIFELKKNTNIIIEPADKGGAIIIMNKQHYIKVGERQLKNQQHYRKLDDYEETKKTFIKEGEIRFIKWGIH